MVRRLVVVAGLLVLLMAGGAQASSQPCHENPTCFPAHVPSSARVLGIYWTDPSRTPVVVTNGRKVRKIARLVDGQRVDPDNVACSEGPSPSIFLFFRRSLHGRALVSLGGVLPERSSSYPCAGTRYSVRGHFKGSLIASDAPLLRKASKILHRDLGRARPS